MNYLLEEFKRTYHYKHRNIKSSKYPDIAAIEITNFCNLRCIMCPYSKMTRKKQHMKFETFKKIVDEIKNYPQGLSWFHMFGEPLLHPKVFDFIKYGKKVGLKIGISTNCTVLDKEKSRKLLKFNIDKIILCLDGNTKKTYEKLRKGAKFEIVKNNIINFLDMKKRGNFSKPHIILQLVKNKYNENEIESFKKEWKDKVDEINISEFGEWGGQVDEISKLSTMKKRNLRFPCEYIWHILAIHSDGNVTICCVDFDKKISLGNVKNQKIYDIWNSKEMKKLREQQIKHNFNNGLCDFCKEWKGSRKNKFYPLEISFLKDLFKSVKR